MRFFCAAFGVVALSAGLCLAAACASPGGASPEDREAVENEIRMGRSLSARLARKYGVLRNQELTRYVNLLARNIAANSSRPELTFRVGILDTDEINAFSCPGGYILVTKGALREMRDESELAFVLAHEISHVALEHSGRFRESAGWLDFVTGVIGGGGNVVNSIVRQTTDQLESELLEGGRQKKLEFEADEAGVILQAQLGYDARSSISYLRRVTDARGSQLFTKTHPDAVARISALTQFILNQGYADTKVTRNESRFQEYKKLIQ